MEKKKTPVIRYVSVVALVLAIIVAAAYLIVKNVKKDEAFRSIKVHEIGGSASITRSGEGTLEAVAGMALKNGDDAETKADSDLTLKLDDDKYVMLESLTKIHLVATGDEKASKTKIELKEGNILNRIENPLSDESSYEVNTKNALMAVRGTEFRVELLSNTGAETVTHLAVIKGVVACTALDAAGNPVGTEVLVNAGEEKYVITDDKGTRIEDDLSSLGYDMGEENETPSANEEAQGRDEAENTGSPLSEYYKAVDIAAYDNIGNAYAGLIPVKSGDLYGAMDYDGNLVVPVQYESFNSPCLAGYMVFRSGEHSVLYDKKGNLITEADGRIAASSDGYVITSAIPYQGDYDETYEGTRYEYYKYDGTLIAEIESGDPDEMVSVDYPHGFYNGVSIVSGHIKPDQSFRDNIYDAVLPYEFGLVESNGNVTWIDGDGSDENDTSKFMTHEESEIALQEDADSHPGIGLSGQRNEVEYALSSPNRGYFVTNGQHLSCFFLRDTKGSLVCGILPWEMTISGDTLNYTTRDEDDYGRSCLCYGGDGYGDNWEDAGINGYYYDGGYKYNYGSKVHIYIGDTNILADFAGGNLTYKVFERLYMSENKYWLVKKDGKWGYIDTDGNVIKLYDDASEFTGGYALVIEGGTAYLIDEDLNVVNEVGPADSVYAVGELLGYSAGGEDHVFAPLK